MVSVDKNPTYHRVWVYNIFSPSRHTSLEAATVSSLTSVVVVILSTIRVRLPALLTTSVVVVWVYVSKGRGVTMQ